MEKPRSVDFDTAQNVLSWISAYIQRTEPYAEATIASIEQVLDEISFDASSYTE